MTQAVLDTNVVISALIWGGKPLTLFRAVADGKLLITRSLHLLNELSDVLTRTQFATRLKGRQLSVEQAIALYASLARILDPPPLPASISRDADDDAVVALAVAAQADLIISGDSDLLVLGYYEGIPIITPSQALIMLEL